MGGEYLSIRSQHTRIAGIEESARSPDQTKERKIWARVMTYGSLLCWPLHARNKVLVLAMFSHAIGKDWEAAEARPVCDVTQSERHLQ